MDKTLGWLAPCGFHSSQELIDAADQAAKERDELKAKCEALEAALGAVNRALKAHLDDADALLEQRDALQAKVQEMEIQLRGMTEARDANWRCFQDAERNHERFAREAEKLEKALREILGFSDGDNNSAALGRIYRIANAALAGGKEQA